MARKLRLTHAALLAAGVCIMLFAAATAQAAIQLVDGNYSMRVQALKENSDELSRIQQSLEPSGTLTVKDGRAIAKITLKDSSDITQFKVERQGAFVDAPVVQTNAAENSRVIEFEVTDLTSPIQAWVAIYIEMPGFVYDQSYQIQLKLDEFKLVYEPKSEPTSSMNLLLYLSNKRAFSNGAAFQLPEAPYLKDGGYTMVPVRFVSENLGADVQWDAREKIVSISYGNESIQMKNGSKQVTVNGVPVTIQTAVEIKNGTTFVPIRFVAEQLGANVSWDPNQKSIAIVR